MSLLVAAVGQGQKAVESSLRALHARSIITFTTTITGSTVFSLLGGTTATFASQIVALGMNTSGTIGMVPAALTAINVVF